MLFVARPQPRSQGPLSNSRKYFLEVEKGPWERGWLSHPSIPLYHFNHCLLSVPEDSVQTEVARGSFSVSFYSLGFVITPPKLGIFCKLTSSLNHLRPVFLNVGSILDCFYHWGTTPQWVYLCSWEDIFKLLFTVAIQRNFVSSVDVFVRFNFKITSWSLAGSLIHVVGHSIWFCNTQCKHNWWF